MREDARQKEYREKLFRNLSANIDFVFLLYTPSAQKVELVSDNQPVLLGITAQQVQERPELVFSASGMAPDDPAGCSFLDGTLKEQDVYKRQGILTVKIIISVFIAILINNAS